VTTLAFGHFVRFYNEGDNVVHSFQNFFIGETITDSDVQYTFVPFGFSGMSTNRQGDLQPATLVFPNTELSRGYLEDALRGRTLRPDDYWQIPYVAEVTSISLTHPAMLLKPSC